MVAVIKAGLNTPERRGDLTKTFQCSILPSLISASDLLNVVHKQVMCKVRNKLFEFKLCCLGVDAFLTVRNRWFASSFETGLHY